MCTAVCNEPNDFFKKLANSARGLRRTLGALCGNFFCKTQAPGGAPTRQGTFRAAGRTRRTERRAQLHQGLVPVAGRVGRKEGLRFALELLPLRRRAQIALRSIETREYARNVAVQDRVRFPVSNAQNG